MQQHLFEHFQSPGHTGFVEDVYITFIDKTDPFIPTKREDYWRQTLKTLAPHGLNIEESVQLFGLYLLLYTDTFKIFDARTLVLGLRFQDLTLILNVNSELCPLFQTERFAKVVSDLELLTNFAERFVLHDCWSSESASAHCNLLVFYGHLLLLLLYLNVVATSY